MAHHADENDIGCGGQAGLVPEQNRGRLVAAHTVLVPASATFATGVLSISNVASTVRYLGIEVDDAIEIAEKTDI